MDQDYILHKYLNGEASAEEIELLRKSPEYSDYLKLADATSEYDLDATFDAPSNFRAIQEGKVRRLAAPSKKSYKRVLQIAAIFVLIAASYVFINSLNTTVSTGIAEKKTFDLPDNSTVSLNASSSISYNKSEWEEDRSLTLAGEAYFNVSKGSKFSVNTKQGMVTVLGTQFNVFARDSVFTVNCFEGLVSVTFKDTDLKLPAGNMVSIHNNRIVLQSEIDMRQPDWTTNESSFENASLATVLTELQRQYPIKITSPDSVLQKRFTGSFGHTNLETALRSVCDPLQLDYTISGNAVTLYAK